MGLNPKQQRFVEEYLIDLNATQAAIRAGYSKKTAHVTGHENLSKPKIAEALQERMAARADRTEITQDRVLVELAKIGFSDPRRILSASGGIHDTQDWADETAGALSSLEVVSRPYGAPDEDGRRVPELVHKIKFWDKLAALEKMGKHLGMFDGAGSGDEDAPGLNISIKASAPVGEVRVTRSDG